MAIDRLDYLGHEPAILGEGTIERLSALLPPHWSKRNPVDILGDATPERYLEAVQICLGTDELDGLIVILTPQAVSNPNEVANRVSKYLSSQSKPVFAVWMGAESVEEGISILNEAGIPTFDTPEEAVTVFMLMYYYSYNLELLQETPRELHAELDLKRESAERLIMNSLSLEKTLLSEIESKELLASYGIPVNRTLIATSAEQAAELATDIGFPVVLKIDSPDITHKTEAGGVILELGSKKDVVLAFQKILGNAKNYNPEAMIEGVSVQRMIKEVGYEIILGSKYDSLFGPVILFGLGGVMTEVIGDKAIGLPPLNSILAKRLVERTKVSKVLRGFRNRPPVDMEWLEMILVRLSHLVTDFPQIREIDINPLLVNEKNIIGLDARVIIKPSKLKSPEHMVIAPYPHRYETHWKTKDGIPILLRPIKPEDEGMILDLFSSFSERTILFRFFQLLKSMPHKQIVRYTQIDYDRDMAIVAVTSEGDKERIVGVGRLNYYPNLETSEFSVVVGDPWQRKGLGTKLLKLCIKIAKERGVSQLWGDIMAENEGMIKLCKRLGFKINWHQEEGIARACMDFN